MIKPNNMPGMMMGMNPALLGMNPFGQYSMQGAPIVVQDPYGATMLMMPVPIGQQPGGSSQSGNPGMQMPVGQASLPAGFSMSAMGNPFALGLTSLGPNNPTGNGQNPNDKNSIQGVMGSQNPYMMNPAMLSMMQ